MTWMSTMHTLQLSYATLPGQQAPCRPHLDVCCRVSMHSSETATVFKTSEKCGLERFSGFIATHRPITNLYTGLYERPLSSLAAS